MHEQKKTAERCVIVVDSELAVGRAANAAAVIALTIGQRHPELVGPALIDASGHEHPGLIPIGITVLAASQSTLTDIRSKGLEARCDIVVFPVQGQQTTHYAAFVEAVAQIASEEMEYVGIALIGERKVISKIVANLALLK
jgi:hypothetical protein